MIRIQFGQQAPGQSERESSYCIAGTTVVSNEPLWPLQPYRLAQPQSSLNKPATNIERVDFRRPRLRRTTGWLGDRLRNLKTVEHQAGTEIYIEDLGRMMVSTDGSQIELPRARDDAHRELLMEAAAGPGLCLALAVQAIFCLHASAVVRHGRATLFCGPSGSGKSTLAQRLPGHPGFDMRLSDDVTAVTLGESGATCLGHFPQLKLGIDEHCTTPRSQRIPIDTVVLVQATGDDERFDVSAIDPAQSIIALARHTVSSRLFRQDTLQQHLRFCGQLADAVETVAVRYPHTVSGIDYVARALSNEPADIAAD